MKKIIILEELVLPSSLTNLNRLDMSAINTVKTDNQLLTDINAAAEERKQKVTIGNSKGNSVGIIKFSDGDNPNMLVSSLSDDVTPKSDYSRVKYFTDILKSKGYIINWANGKMTITKSDDKVTKPKIDKNDTDDISPDLSGAQAMLTSMLAPSISDLNILKNKKSPKIESIVKEEINRIKKLMK